MKNQDALAHSRLWDAVSGFIHIFAALQRKLYKDTSQMELLRELLGLQEEMFILLLSMLEGRDGNPVRGLLSFSMATDIHNSN
jgi:ryanodine receptor 2